jgi:hypothetical protein
MPVMEPTPKNCLLAYSDRFTVRLAPGTEDIVKKLSAAEERRRQLAGNRTEKVSQHNKAVDLRKSSDDL